MISHDASQLFNELGDGSAKLNRRLMAARKLAMHNDPDVLTRLICIAEDESTEPVLSREVGASVAKILVQRGSLDQVPLHNFSDDAYLGYDEVVARHLKTHSC